MKLFGFEIKPLRKAEKEHESFAPKVQDDGATNVSAVGGAVGTYMDLDATVRSEAQLISKYRNMTLQPEIDRAVNEIVNESVMPDEDDDTVDINLDAIEELPEQIKEVLRAEFQEILELLDFKNKAWELFRRWYIDGRMYLHIIVDEKRKMEGIKELRYVDPRTMRKVREVKQENKNGVTVMKTVNEFFMYSDKTDDANPRQYVKTVDNSKGVRISKDAIVHATSGLMDVNNRVALGYLHPAIKPLNQLRAVEDATLIYHLSRAPERRIFYIDVGNLPKLKAEQYMKELMTRYKNRVQYDAATGELKDNRRFQTFLEDFWLPRREGGRGTQIDTLSGGTQLSQLLETVEYFQRNLNRSLNVPEGRLDPQDNFSLGRSVEITREEINFHKFISRLRARFSDIFMQALEKQVILKGLFTVEEWLSFKDRIKFEFAKDNYFTELKNLELLSERLVRLRDMDAYAGKYFSHRWIRKNVLGQTDEEMEIMDAEIQEEEQNPQYITSFQAQMEMMGEEVENSDLAHLECLE